MKTKNTQAIDFQSIKKSVFHKEKKTLNKYIDHILSKEYTDKYFQETNINHTEKKPI
jgi:hypothetical protein